MKTDTPSTSFEVISINTVGSMRVDKFVFAYPMQSKGYVTIATTLVNQFIMKFGIFKVLRSDRGTEFLNALMNEICEQLNVEQVFSTPYHHETIGAFERNHRVLNEDMLSFTEENEWHKWVPFYVFVYNVTPLTEYSPYELIFGKLAYLPTDTIRNRPVK